MIGQQIGQYKIDEKLASGGFGLVYRAHHVVLDREVAIKVVLPHRANDLKFIDDFVREARLVAKLEHDNIVRLYEFWQDENGAFLVMQYMRGGTLRNALEMDGISLSYDKVKDIVGRIANGLNFAHSKNIIHRDVKPENIIFDEQAKAFLADFGIAKDLSLSSNTDGKPATLAYAAPEQLRGEKLSFATDIHALGVISYEMLTGKHPFHDYQRNLAAMAQHLLNTNLPYINELSDDVNSVIQRATAKNPKDRYQSALDFFSAFDATFDGIQTRNHMRKHLDDAVYEETSKVDRFQYDGPAALLSTKINPKLAARKERPWPIVWKRLPKSIQIAVWLFLGLMLVTTLVIAVRLERYDIQCQLRIIPEALNIRYGPSVDYSRFELLFANELVEPDGQIENIHGTTWWYLSSHVGWISGAYVGETGNCDNVPSITNNPLTPSVTSQSIPAEANGCIIIMQEKQRLFIHKDPNSDIYAGIRVLYPGESVHVLDQYDSGETTWWHVRVDDQTKGWINPHSKYHSTEGRLCERLSNVVVVTPPIP